MAVTQTIGALMPSLPASGLSRLTVGVEDVELQHQSLLRGTGGITPDGSSPSSRGFGAAAVPASFAVAAIAVGQRMSRWRRRCMPLKSRARHQAGLRLIGSTKVQRSRHVVEAGSKARVDAGAAPLASDQKMWKWLTFWTCFFGYSVFYFTRQSLTYTGPVLQRAMGWDSLAQLGALSSLFPLAYGSSRFLGGVLGDRMSPKNVFAVGLTICGLLNIAFGLSSSLPCFAAFWFLNGCFQGLGAPPCVKMITNWFDPKERGLWWSIWHASINVGGFLIPFVSGNLAESFGWRFGMLGPGVLALVTAAISLVLMRDGPVTSTVVSGGDVDNGAEADASKPIENKEEPAAISIVDGLLKSPAQWALGLAYFLVYVCRQGLGIWTVFYLLHQGVPSAAKAAALFSGFELGGFMGNLTAGALSDFLLRRAGPNDGGPGQRAKVVGVYFFCTIPLLLLFSRCPPSLPWLQYLILMALGHFLCGAQLLLPLIAAEVAPTSLLATATGFIGFIGYFGAALAGFPLSVVVQKFGWGYYFGALTVAATAGACLVAPLRGLRSWQQEQDLAAA